METVIIRPKRQSPEIIFMLSSVVAIFAIASLVFLITNTAGVGRAQLRAHQIDAFYALSGHNQGIFSDLFSAALEIEALHRYNGEVWPSIAELQDPYLALSPFTEDALWRLRGQHRWTLFRQDHGTVHRAIYVGRSSNEEVAGNFLLLSEHFHTMDGAEFIGMNRERPYTIWFNAEWSLPNADNISEGTLIAAGWREAVPFTGDDELRRLGR